MTDTPTDTAAEVAPDTTEAAGRLLAEADTEPVFWTRAEKEEVLNFVRALVPIVEQLGAFTVALDSPAGARIAKMMGVDPSAVIG